MPVYVTCSASVFPSLSRRDALNLEAISEVLFGELSRLCEEGVTLVDVSPEGLEYAVCVEPCHVEQPTAADGEAHLKT